MESFRRKVPMQFHPFVVRPSTTQLLQDNIPITSLMMNKGRCVAPVEFYVCLRLTVPPRAWFFRPGLTSLDVPFLRLGALRIHSAAAAPCPNLGGSLQNEKGIVFVSLTPPIAVSRINAWCTKADPTTVRDCECLVT